MAKRKRNIIMLLTICVSIILGGIIDAPVLAQEIIDGDLTYEEGAVDYITPEMLTLEQQKLNSLYRNRVSYPSSIKISVTQFPQQNGYYCGPATVKQVVHWINGSSNSQDWYAEKLGTTKDGTNMTCIPDVLNDCIDEQFYVYSSMGTQTEWMDKIRSSVYNDRPAILDINTIELCKEEKFPYPTKGHFVNVSGYSSTQVMITDPNDARGNVWYDIDVLYSANSAHFRQAIVW
ncbi:MAG: C39 family peptidase [Acetatifactor sp.]|nr:C39 family peptidase [Acetatifactor sp.]MDE7113340.1 C39 family peptidase [Acetatifactor sp.]